MFLTMVVSTDGKGVALTVRVWQGEWAKGKR